MESLNIRITEHAEERLKERLGYTKKSMQRMVQKAYTEGICHKDLKYGNLSKYISNQILKHPAKGSQIRLFGEFVYVFVKEEDEIRLITIFEIPQNLKVKSLGQQKKAN